jgi:hypothetical protein
VNRRRGERKEKHLLQILRIFQKKPKEKKEAVSFLLVSSSHQKKKKNLSSIGDFAALSYGLHQERSLAREDVNLACSLRPLFWLLTPEEPISNPSPREGGKALRSQI